MSKAQSEIRESVNAPSDPGGWVELHGDHLYRYALMRLRNTEQAEDLVQETFVAAIKGRKQFSGKSSERTWLIGILKHKIVDHIRKAQRERPATEFETDEFSIDHLFEADGHWKKPAGEWPANPAELLERQQFWQVLDKCLAGLPEKLAQAFSLRTIEELNSEEVCKILGITPTNLWVMLHRARLRLRDCLSLNWFENEKRREPADER